MFSVLCVNMNTNRLKVSDKYNLNLQLTKGFFGVQDTVLFEDSPSECLSKMSLSKKTHSNLRKKTSYLCTRSRTTGGSVKLGFQKPPAELAGNILDLRPLLTELLRYRR